MADKKYIVDMFEEIVDNVRANYDPVSLLEPYYDHGHPISIMNKLTVKDGEKVYKFQKYPLIALIQDIQETHSSDLGITYSFSPRIVILSTTDKNYTEQERYTNVFKPILYPIYEEFIEQVHGYYHFVFESYPAYEKYDRVYWGTSNIFGNEATMFNDYLDGIELIFDPINVKRRNGLSC